ncbi:hypothetical protein DFJ77DRAFT_479648 [Powellomyces hirtus]|nr:hypothetical protein DFJ77DRAFT_479648 [Powellomyces hirtus]
MGYTLDDSVFPFPLPLESRIMSLTLGMVLLLSFVVNGAVLYVFIRERLLWSPSNCLLLSMVFSDFMFAILSGPVISLNGIRGNYEFSQVCQWQAFGTYLFAVGQVLTTAAIAVERYLAIVKQVPSTPKIIIILLLVCWSIATLFATIPMFTQTYHIRRTGMTCGILFSVRQPPIILQGTLVSVALSMAIMLTISLYYKTFLVVRKTTREFREVYDSRLLERTTHIGTNNNVSTTEEAGEERALDVPQSTQWRVWLEGLKTVMQFFVRGVNVDLDDEESIDSSEGKFKKSKDATKTSTRSPKEGARMDEIVFNRSIRIVACIFVGWFLLDVMFVGELLTGGIPPKVLDMVAHAIATSVSLINPLVIINDNRHFRTAFVRHLPISRYLLRYDLGNGAVTRPPTGVSG